VAALDAISPGRMVAALAAARCFGAVVASLGGSGAPAGAAPVTAVVGFAGALAIAALLITPVVTVDAMRSGAWLGGAAA
jgi:hypothetical protein